MNPRSNFLPGIAILIATAGPLAAGAQDWPQWRGAQRDGRATEFTAPKAWPKELTKKWTVTVGEGVATPALVGDHLYVFSRQDGSEVTRCLATADGKELWADKYESLGATGPAQGSPNGAAFRTAAPLALPGTARL